MTTHALLLMNECPQERRTSMLRRLASTFFITPTAAAVLIVSPSVALTILSAQTVTSGGAHLLAPYTPQVWDVDWSYLAKPGTDRDWTDNLHYIPSGRDPANFLSINAQIRERGEYQDHPDFGAQPADNGYLLQRYLVSGDLHLGEHFRTFIQLDSSLSDLRDGGPRPGIDEEKLDVNQGFVDLALWKKDQNNSLNVRAGRQLVSLGSTRLVAIGAGLNVQQPFDGFRLTLNTSEWTAEAIALRPVVFNPGVFDNQPNSAAELWGVYLTHPFPHVKRLSADLYYLGYDHKSARYVQGIGREQRETIGARLWSHTSTWDYDFEYTAQFGRFGSGNIRAWGAGYHLGYIFKRAQFIPHPEIDGGILSGDHNPKDNTLSTFNPLFPNGNYLNESVLLGPYNLAIVRPTMRFTLSPRLSSNTNFEVLWRQAEQDGVYNIAGFLIHPPNDSKSHFIGAQVQEELDYSFSRHLTGAFAYEHFFPGAFLKQSPPGKGLNFISPQLMWNF